MSTSNNRPTAQPWQRVSRDLHADCRVFKVFRSVGIHPQTGSRGEFFVIDGADWAAALALTPDRKLVMINQFRWGVEKPSWEIPAGCVDHGEDPLAAGVRELLEESGYAGDNPRIIGQCHPNPAMQTNTCTFILVDNARPVAAQTPDEHEDILVDTIPLNDVFAMARSGDIHHGVALNGLFFLREAMAASGQGSRKRLE